MRKRVFLGIALTACAMLFCSPTSIAAGKDSSPILGVAESQWQTDLKIVGGEYTFSDTFLKEVADSQHKLESKYSAEHFEKLNSRQESSRAQRRNNPLIHRRQIPARSSFILDLKLDKQDYSRLMKYIPLLGTYYGEHHIAKMLPYIAYCLNYDVKISELEYYLKEFLRRQTPPDIACERLYTLAEEGIL